MVRQAINVFICGQFGLYASVNEGSFDLSADEFSRHFSSVSEIMFAWAPKILGESLTQQVQCKRAWWDAEGGRIVVER